MSDKLRAFVLGFTNAFIPIDYSEINNVGEISRRIDRRMSTFRGLTNDRINEITAQSSQSKSIKTSANSK